MNPRKRLACVLAGLVVCFLIFAAGVTVGIGYESHLSRWSRNIDLSDYISTGIIIVLSIALWLSLTSQEKTGDP